MDWKTLFFSAEGRIGRQAFWIGWLVLAGVNVVLGWIPVLGWLISLVGIYATVCVFSKRLHDMGKSGWLQVIPFVLCVVLGIGSVVMMGGPAAMMAMSGATEEQVAGAAMGGLGLMAMGLGLMFLIGLLFTLWVGLSKGDPGENKYGPAPSQPVVA